MTHSLVEIERYYSSKIQEHGRTPNGVDWNNEASQSIRFSQLLKIIENNEAFTINDLGCGYGSILDYMKEANVEPKLYNGYDISAAMISSAKERFNIEKNYRTNFFCVKNSSEMSIMDYTISSGIFNVKLEAEKDEWFSYIIDTINTMSTLSNKGFSFNCLTKYSDREKMRPSLYYADPSAIFDYCKLNISKNVSLLHDYGLYEFTILVRG